MPNWCWNTIEVFDTQEDHPNRDRFYSPEDLDVHVVTPLQKHLPMSEYHKTHEGYNDGGYEWCIITWGTKWPENDLEIIQNDLSCMEISFESAWAPPIEGYQSISKLFPQLYFLHFWQEEGMCFAGSAVYNDGNVRFMKECGEKDWPEWDENDDNNDSYHQKLFELHYSLRSSAKEALDNLMRIE